MKAKYLLFFFITSFLMSCSASKTSATPEQIRVLDQLVSERAFTIQLEWALPLVTNSLMNLQNAGLLTPGDNMNRIRLTGNSSDFVIKDSVVTSHLPYYGERQILSDYNGRDSAIEFEGPYKNYQVTKSENSSYKIEFDAISHNENFDVTILLYPNLKGEIVLNSARRNTIRYEGRVNANLE